MLVGSQLKKEPLDPALVRERERKHYEQVSCDFISVNGYPITIGLLPRV